MKIEPPIFDVRKFPLKNDFPSQSTKQTCGHVLNVAHHTAQSNRGDKYDNRLVTWHTREQLYFLYDLALGKYSDPYLDGHIFQGGVFCGVSACVMALALKNSGKEKKSVVAVDVFRGVARDLTKMGTEHWAFEVVSPQVLSFWNFTEARQNIVGLNLEGWMCLSMCDDVTVARLLESKFALVMLDSCHEYGHVINELEATCPLVIENGFLVVDDYLSHDGVRRAVHEYFNNYDSRPFWFYVFESDNRQRQKVVVKFNGPI